ncbi:nol10 [Scenedesmus sp. PABB004]|nr:nol10 [Scenedesmus sp. PABB004]
MAWPERPETERLFGDSVPSVPLSTASASHGSLAPLAAAGGGGGFWEENTLDESVWATLKRDVLTIGRNLRSVLIPVNWDFQNHQAALHNWDLWGPLVRRRRAPQVRRPPRAAAVRAAAPRRPPAGAAAARDAAQIFMLGLAITLSVGEQKPSDVFALVFTEVALGACVLTVNVILLGGSIVFFQSLCLIGYCLFPIVIAAIVCVLVKMAWVRTLVLVACLGWASFATVPFIGKTVSSERRALAVYPVLLMYVSIGWLALVSAPDGVKVYTVGSGKTMPAWLSEAKKRALRKDEDYRRRLELLQDLQFPSACQRIKITPDQQYIFATGYHPPMVKLYDLHNLSLKFDRHLDAEVVDMVVLSDDYSKLALLCADRSISFHARFGSYTKTRTPRQGRDLAYAHASAELLVVGSAPEVWRLSLAEGRFMAPLPAKSSGINACGLSPTHGLFAAAGEDGLLECFDLRQRGSVAVLDAAAAAGAPGAQLTALRFDDSGLQLAAGTSSGLVGLWDLRCAAPLLVKDHMYGAAIRDIKFHSGAAGVGGGGSSLDVRRVISADRHIIKVWDASSGAGYTSIEPADGADINDVALWPGSGLLLVGSDAPRIGSYFVPSLGPAPRWCSFLEGLTEELEEAAPAVYDDYRFVTRADLGRLGLEHLLGSPLLRAYMHGFFMDARLYAKAAAAAQPFAYEAYRAARVAAKLEEERQGRISVVRKLPKVNRAVAARLLAQQEAEAGDAAEGGDGAPGAKRRKGEPASNPLADERFAAMFEDEAFTVDPLSDEYRALHPNLPAPGAAGGRRGQDALLAEHFTPLSDEDSDGDGASDGGASGSDGDADDGSDDGSDDGPGEAPQQQRKQGHWQQLKRQQPDSGQQQHAGKAARPRAPSMYAAKDAAAAAAFQRGESMAATLSQPLEARVHGAVGDAGARRQFVGGSRELTFVPGGGGRRGRGRGRGRSADRDGPGGGGGRGSSAVGGGGRGRGGGGGGRGRGGGGRGGSRGGGRGRGGGRR